MGGFKWDKIYFSMAATPLRTVDIVDAQLVFLAFRIFLPCIVFLGVLGALRSRRLMVAARRSRSSPPCCSAWRTRAPVAALSSRVRDESGFALVFRLGAAADVAVQRGVLPHRRAADGDRSGSPI